MHSRMQERRDTSVSPEPGPRQNDAPPPHPRLKKDTGPAAQDRFKIPVEKIPLLIGHKGATITEIEKKSATRILVDKGDGTVSISSRDTARVRQARQLIEDLMKEKPRPGPSPVLPEVEVSVGAMYQVTVVSIMDFGCFVQLPSGQKFLLHISQIDHCFIHKVEEVLKIRDVIFVKCIGKNEKGQPIMSRKAMTEEHGGGAARCGGGGAARWPPRA